MLLPQSLNLSPNLNGRNLNYLKISHETVQILLTHKRHQSLNKAKWTKDNKLIFPNTVGQLGDEKSDRLAFKNLLKAAGVTRYRLSQLRKTAFTAMAGQTDLKTLMEFSGHSQVSTVIGNYIFATSESMTKAVNGMDQLRPG
jgi:integrase